MADEGALRAELSRYGRRLVDSGLVTGPGGNISARAGETVYLSPSGLSLAEIAPGDWCPVAIGRGAAGAAAGGRRPTCETTMHLGCYLADPSLRAVFHTHPVTATALASTGVPFRAPFPDFVALLGAAVPVVGFTTPGGEEIRRAVTDRLAAGARAVLLKNHGAVAVGAGLKEAYFRSLVLEEAARFMLAALASGRPVPFLTDEQVRAIERLPCEDYRKMLLREQG